MRATIKVLLVIFFLLGASAIYIKVSNPITQAQKIAKKSSPLSKKTPLSYIEQEGPLSAEFKERTGEDSVDIRKPSDIQPPDNYREKASEQIKNIAQPSAKNNSYAQAEIQQAQDSDSQQSEIFFVNLFTILNQDLPNPILQEEYYVSLRVIGGVEPYTWGIVSGRLPEGLSLHKTGVLYGKAKKLEVTRLSIEVEDARGSKASRDYKCVVIEKKSEQEAFNNEQAISITNTALANAMVGLDYYHKFSVSAGKPPYLWKIISGGLPQDLFFDQKSGVLYGTPKEGGFFSFDIGVTDANGYFISANCFLKIDASDLYIISGTPAPALTGQFYSYHFLAQGGTPPYRWQIIAGELPGGINFDSADGFLSGTPQLPAQTKIIIKVCDEAGKFDIAEFRLAVEEFPPTIITDVLNEGKEGLYYTQILQATGGILPYTWFLDSGTLPTGLNLDQNKGVIYGTPAHYSNQKLRIVLTDSIGKSASKELNLVISPEPLSILGPFSFTITVGSEFFHQIEGCGGFSPYSWSISGDLPQGITFNEAGHYFSGIPQEPQTKSVKITITDQNQDTLSKDIRFNILPTGLEIISGQELSAIIGSEFNFELKAVGGAPPYLWELISGNLPEGLILIKTGKISGVPAPEKGEFNFSLRVSDQNALSAIKSFSLNLYELLQILSPELENGKAGLDYQSHFEAKGGLPPYHWSIISGGLPVGLFLNEQSGEISGIPTTGQTYEFSIEVKDALTNSAVSLNNVIVILSAPLLIKNYFCPDAQVNQNYNLQFQVEGGVAPCHWGIKSGELPAGLSLNRFSGLLSGIPNLSGAFNLQIEVTDSLGFSDSKTYVMNVAPAPLKILTGPSLPSAVINNSYNLQFEAAAGNPPYTWSLYSGRLPSGLELSRQGLLSGFAKELGAYKFRIQASDDIQDVHKEFLLAVRGVPIGPVTNFVAYPSNAKAGLSWTNPTDLNFAKVLIVRSNKDFPANPADGTIVYEGGADNMVDTGLRNGITYYYSAFALDNEGNKSLLQSDSKAGLIAQEVTLSGPNDPFADRVISFNPLTAGGFGASFIPNNVLGAPAGGGEFKPQDQPNELVSLHARENLDDGATPPYGGSIILEFTDNLVVNGPGVDFTVFENVLYKGGVSENRFMEPAVIEVSQDGINFYRFPFDFVPHYNAEGKINYYNPYSYAYGFAGINPVYSNGSYPDPTDPSVSGGDSFDLDSITRKNLTWIKYIMVISTGDNWLIDVNGDRVRHNCDPGFWSCIGRGNAGFDLDAVSAVNY